MRSALFPLGAEAGIALEFGRVTKVVFLFADAEKAQAGLLAGQTQADADIGPARRTASATLRCP